MVCTVLCHSHAVWCVSHSGCKLLNLNTSDAICTSLSCALPLTLRGTEHHFVNHMQAEHPPPGWALSATLLSGFWLMLLLDSFSHWLPSSTSSSSSSVGHTVHRSRSDAAHPDDFDVPVGGSGRVLGGSSGLNPAVESSDEHTVLLTDFGVQHDQQGLLDSAGYAAAAEAAEAAEGIGVGPGPLHTPQEAGRRTGASPRRTATAARSGGSNAGSPGASTGGVAAAAAAAAAAAGASLTSPSRMSIGGGSAAAGAPARRLAAVASGSNAASPAAGSSAAAVDGSSGQASAAGGGGGFDGVYMSTSGAGGSKELQVTSSGSGAVSLTGRKVVGAGVAAGGVDGEWWRPWLVDPTHHALLGLLVHSGGFVVGLTG
jgi:hypothetical protein